MPRIIDADRPAVDIVAAAHDAAADKAAALADAADLARYPLPAAMIRHMVEHVSAYAVVLTSGVTLYIDVLHAIIAAADGTLWLEAHLLQHGADGEPNPHPFKAATGDVLINAASVAAAFEIRQ